MIFKYRPINKYTISALVNSELYFAPPEDLNDPFDCNLNIIKSLDSAIELATGTTKAKLSKLRKLNQYFDTIQGMLSRSGVCSFSLDQINPLLWSHYSNDHRGLCLSYDIPDEFIEYGANKIAGMAPVTYEENPLIEWFLNDSEELFDSGHIAFGTELAKKLLTFKAPCWKYENEIRIVRIGTGRLSIDQSFLKQVCFGLNTPEEDIETIMTIVKNNGYEVTFCKKERTASDFGIDAKEI